MLALTQFLSRRWSSGDALEQKFRFFSVTTPRDIISFLFNPIDCEDHFASATLIGFRPDRIVYRNRQKRFATRACDLSLTRYRARKTDFVDPWIAGVEHKNLMRMLLQLTPHCDGALGAGVNRQGHQDQPSRCSAMANASIIVPVERDF